MKLPSATARLVKLAAAATLLFGVVATSPRSFADGSTLYPDVEDVIDGASAPDPDATTEARFCATCGGRVHNDRAPERIAPSRIQNLEFGGSTHSSQEACLSKAILESAKRVTKRVYRNRGTSGGYCARGVNAHLNAAGLFTGNGADAIDWHARGKLNALGFKNFIAQYPTPDKAPPGAVLVFAGPATDKYLVNGQKIYSSSRRHHARHGRHGHRAKFRRGGAGNWAGHITIAGESRGHGKRWYYTDARTPEAATGWPYNKITRRLVGVYLMQSCGPDCSPALRARCGG